MHSEREKTRKRYNRIAPYFDTLEAVMEGFFFSRWRQALWQQASGRHILEVGVGTGKNFRFYPNAPHITGIDFSPKMLDEAQKKQLRHQVDVNLCLMDVESLDFADNSFDTVIGTFVFCSVPKPNRGLRELYRVCKPGGQVLLLEHVLSSHKVMAQLMNRLNPVVKSLVGANINRQTVKSVQALAFRHVQLNPASSDIIKLIKAIK